MISAVSPNGSAPGSAERYGSPPSGAELRAIAEIWKRQRRELVAAFGGTSMLPAIAPGQPLRLRCGEAYAIGDVIAFVIEGQMAVHRVIAQGEGWIVTRGDARLLPDPPLTELDRVVGRVVALIDGEAERPVPPARFSIPAAIVTRFILTGALDAAAITRRMTLLRRIRERF